MSLTKTPTSMIDTTGAASGQVLTYSGSTATWVASAAPGNTTSATSVKAWVNFNGTTSPGTIRASYNVSSITYNSQGDYTVNFATNALPDDNYVVVLAPGSCASNSVIVGALQASANWAAPTTYTASAVRIISTGVGATGNPPIFGLVAFR